MLGRLPDHAQHVRERSEAQHVGQHVYRRTCSSRPSQARRVESTQALDKTRHHIAETVWVRRSRGETDALASSDAREREQLEQGTSTKG